jgi:hypothetical protein
MITEQEERELFDKLSTLPVEHRNMLMRIILKNMKARSEKLQAIDELTKIFRRIDLIKSVYLQ